MFILVCSLLIFSKYDFLEKIFETSAQYEEFEIDEIVSTFLVLVIYLIWFSIRKLREAIKANNLSQQKNKELASALDEIKTLKGILPICMHCKGIRDDSGTWGKIENYIAENSYAEFSHAICEECLKEHYPDDD